MNPGCRKLYLLVLLVALDLAGTCSAQSMAHQAAQTLIVESRVLQEVCTVFVALPENYGAGSENYPVIYVLDGAYYHSLTTEASILLTRSGLAPASIVVGITTNNRQRDFSPPVDPEAGQSRDVGVAGGAENFLRHLQSELIPAVESNFRTTPFRVLIGHSTGGLLAYYSLYKTPNLFPAIISIDGSTWWNKGKVGRELMKYLEDHPAVTGQIFECRKDIKIPVQFAPNTELLHYLENRRPKGLGYTYLELPNETHGTIVFPGTYYGLKGIFAAVKK